MVILEHERWAAPLAEQVTEALARDIEQRRTDVVAPIEASIGQERPPMKIRVDLVRMSAQRDSRATLEAHRRILDPAALTDEIGGETFSHHRGIGTSGVARAFSEALVSLADRLVEKLPAPPAG